MQYTLADRILPAYYRNNYNGEYRLLFGKMNSPLRDDRIRALHYHSCAEIGICIQGSGVTYIEDRIYEFSAGDLQYISPGVPHLSAATPGVETRWHWISLEPQRILKESGFQDPELLRELSGNSFDGVFHPQEHPRLADIFYRLRDQLLQQMLYAREELIFLSGQLLVECARIGKEGDRGDTKRRSGGKLAPAIRYIRENYPNKEVMREEQIARTCNMSSSHFRAVFKRETGISVRDFILQTRLARGAYLLKSTDSSVLRIALESGFGQASCFNRMFVQHFGQTPTAYRKSTRNKEK